MKRAWLAIVGAVFGAATFAFASESYRPANKPQRPDAVAARAKYDQAIADATEAFRKAVLAADQAYVTDLTAAREAAVANHAAADEVARIDAALKEAKERLQKDQGPGGGDPPAATAAKKAAARANLAALSAALDMFEVDFGRYPTTEEGLDALVHPPADHTNWHGPYVQKLPFDPWGHAYQYNRPGRNAPYEVICFGADGRVGGDGADKDIASWNLKEAPAK